MRSRASRKKGARRVGQDVTAYLGQAPVCQDGDVLLQDHALPSARLVRPATCPVGAAASKRLNASCDVTQKPVHANASPCWRVDGHHLDLSFTVLVVHLLSI